MKIKGILLSVIIFLFIIFLIALRLRDLGMSPENIITIVILFAVTVIISGTIVFLLTKGVRKKLDDELKKRED